MSSENLVSVDFEVFGTVQGVFFRKHTRETAREHNCVGWVMNTRQDTVKGVVQGTAKDIEFMKNWLSRVGSPDSDIKDCNFANERKISSFEFSNFSVHH